ncbi:myeloid-derived growth factor-like [Pomacea canaliculata]|uniref:myeloid-derived growth factor-like n=1 Tax=Pomacea canaliculata TaxID=400727 RepID=UPI000D73046C|nr:myeloid-derived growth factor-like [Pomacea canaliculata]
MNTEVSLVLLVVFFVFCQSQDSVQDVFNVQPGGQTMVFEKDWEGYKCSFTYQAQGGTNEQWQVIVEYVNDRKGIQCTVARGQVSYLFFQKFSLSISGPGVKIIQESCEAIDTGDRPLSNKEYSVNLGSNSLSSVDGAFKNHLERVTIQAEVKQKREL